MKGILVLIVFVLFCSVSFAYSPSDKPNAGLGTTFWGRTPWGVCPAYGPESELIGYAWR